MHILVIDNFDSFTYNLVHYLEDINSARVNVLRNHELENVQIDHYDAVVLSPGPGLPKEAGQLMSFIQKYHQGIPILGVCLGMQALVEQYGGVHYNMPEVLHGRQTAIRITDAKDALFNGLPLEIRVGRYHSWALKSTDLPESLHALAYDENQFVMALRHETLPIYGVQFHPESILSPEGKQLLTNWMNQL